MIGSTGLSRSDGVVLFETLFLMTLLVGLLVGAHVGVVRYWDDVLRKLESKRLPYDGERLWRE